MQICPGIKMVVWIGFIWLGQGLVAGSWEYGNETWGFIKGTGFFSKLSDWYLVK
jgi:hypothetical protein